MFRRIQKPSLDTSYHVNIREKLVNNTLLNIIIDISILHANNSYKLISYAVTINIYYKLIYVNA
jgi:hypothetical protein